MFEEVRVAVAVLQRRVDVVRDPLPVGDGAGVAGVHRGVLLGVELVVVGPLEEVDLVVAAPHKGGVHVARNSFEPVRYLLRKTLKDALCLKLFGDFLCVLNLV